MQNQIQRYDIAIIGTGPAGISAAITSKVRNKNILLIGSRDLSLKVGKAHSILNYPGLPNVSGENLKQALLEHLKALEIDITDDKVNTVYAMGKYFAIQGHAGNYEADSVIVAAGLSVEKPYIGEIENLGRGVSYCATCDAALYRGKTAIVIAGSQKEEKEAEFLAEVADKVYYLSMYKEEVKIDKKNVEIIGEIKPKEIKRENGTMVLMAEEKDIVADGIFILREQVAPSQLVPGLKVENNTIVVDRKMQTNLKGMFACGDITGAPYQYIKAAGEGNVAALSAVNYLANK